MTLFQTPTKMGKGVLVSPTVHGNLLLGPSAIDVEDGTAVETTAPGAEAGGGCGAQDLAEREPA